LIISYNQLIAKGYENKEIKTPEYIQKMFTENNPIKRKYRIEENQGDIKEFYQFWIFQK
jgi:hypothetical protein